jgi:aspartate carbamoyltransferase regulatory subunit
MDERGKSILLATFCFRAEVMKSCRKLWSTFPNDQNLNKIFLLRIEGENKKILTYNLDAQSSRVNYKEILVSTVQIHRNKQTKTLYTIDAINAIQMEKNGKIDPNFRINWEDYVESLLIERDDKIVILRTQLERIFFRDRERENEKNDNLEYDCHEYDEKQYEPEDFFDEDDR